jgi:hypothetical protein
MKTDDGLRMRLRKIAARVMKQHGAEHLSEVEDEIMAACQDECRRDPELREALVRYGVERQAQLIMATRLMPFDKADEYAKALIAQGIPLPRTGVYEGRAKEVCLLTSAELLCAVQHCLRLQAEYSDNDDDTDALREAASALMAYRRAKFGAEGGAGISSDDEK